ncbi:hypothetical protein JK635_07690 [Neobacillus sp. YIM B02564]|uniref:Uncharacterized protein n=1 Tax=Neobacillus paridis TaxID=2803862 RepID=A0ABS1TPD8_9BACI|nr:hypothetical protein [Neobacillus paridis]MBL4952091.1 hypothetical protein [Neobacillus paridis]
MNQALLKQRRRYGEFELHQLYRQGELEKDRKGYYSYEKQLDMLGEEVRGEKFYIEETYRFIEDKILLLYNEGEKLKRQLEYIHPARDFWHIQSIMHQLLMTDIKLLLLHSLHEGYEMDGFFSTKQVNEWFEDKIQGGTFTELFDEVMTSFSESPLGILEHFCRVIVDCMEDSVFPTESCNFIDMTSTSAVIKL